MNKRAVLIVLDSVGVGELPDADVDYILNACLDVTQIRQDTGGFARLRVN